MPAFSSVTQLSGTASTLSDTHDAGFYSVPHRGAILFGVIFSILRKKKILALTGTLLAIAATALGGSSVQINETLRDGRAIGLISTIIKLQAKLRTAAAALGS